MMFIRGLLLLILAARFDAVKTYPECQPISEWRDSWIGSEVKIGTWFEERSWGKTGSLQNSSSLTKNLIIEYNFQDLVSHKYFDYLEVNRFGANITKKRETIREPEYVKFPQPLGVGWLEFKFKTNSTVELWHKSTKLVSLQRYKALDKLTVVGSNVTINCHRLELKWSVSSENSAIIPLSWSNNTDQLLSFYSNITSQPILTLSNVNDTVPLGWDTTVIQDQVFVKVTCRETPEIGYKCNLINSNENKDIKTYFLSSLPKSISVASGNGVQFWVFLHKEVNQKIESDVTVFIIIGVLLAVITIAFIGCVIFFSVKRRTRPEKTHTENTENDPEETIPLAKPESSNLAWSIPAPNIQSISMRPEMTPTENTENDPDQMDSFIPAPNTQSISMRPAMTLPESSNQIWSIPAPNTQSISMDPRMWKAVVDDDQELVGELLHQGVNPFKSETGQHPSAYVEAHFLGRKEILQLMFISKKNPPISAEELIETIQNELERRMKAVFRVAKNGFYTKNQGIKMLLKAHSLPVTIMDQKGRSLGHCIASSQLYSDNCRPAWDAEDIENFLQNPECYINAVDFWGSTALHILATQYINPIQEYSPQQWRGQQIKVGEIWLDVAKIFLDNGCDPRIADHRGFLAHELAIENGHHNLGALLKQECNRLEKVDHEKVIDKFPELADAAGKGDTNGIIKLLKDHVPLLPICAQIDPLVEAIRCNQRETVFLLLSAGAPLNNQSIEDLTPMEAAHSTVKLPAFFPALMRKVYSERLLEEKRHIPSTDHNYERLRRSMEEYAQQVIESGCKAKWTFTHHANIKERSREARQLLLQAAELGLSLVCQILSMENVYLHYIHYEEKPFSKAAKNNQVYTQLALCRDLKMSPFASPSSLKFLNVNLYRDIFINQIKILVNKIEDELGHCMYDEERPKIQNYIKSLKQVSPVSKSLLNTQELQAPPDMLLYLIARYGLDAILWIIANKYKNFDINSVTDLAGSTLLHIACINGQMNVIEFLIYHGAKLDLTTIGRITPAHLAAVSGHKETFAYIDDYRESKGIQMNQKCDMGISLSEMMDQYANFCKKHETQLISHKDALQIKNEKGVSNQAYEILKRKGKKMSIHNPSDLFNCVEQNACGKEEIVEILKLTERETQRICDKLENTEFKGKIVSVGHLAEENEVFTIYNVAFILELTKFQGLGDTPTITCKGVINDGIFNAEIESKENPELFVGTNLIQKFYQALKASLKQYESPSSEISLAPPFLRPSNKGVRFYVGINGKYSYNYIAVDLVPVIAVPLPDESRSNAVTKELIKRKQNHTHLYFCNVRRKWYHQFYHFDNLFFRSLSGDEKRIWMACHFIWKLLRPCAWAPRFSIRQYSNPWHTLSVGVPFPQPRDIKDLFLYEQENRRNSKGDEDLLEWLLSIYKRAADKDEFGKWKAHRTESYHHRGYFNKGKEAVCGILRYLEMLRDEGGSVSSTSPE